jgi:hypothetical protein
MKKRYMAPELRRRGDLRTNTRGDGSAGNDDTWLWFSWGTDPS